MLVSDPANVVRYVGGYTAEKQSAFILDQRILGELAAGGTPKALPMFGCAVSEKLRGSVDPLGLRQ